MADEITLSGALAYLDSELTSDELSVSGLTASVATKLIQRIKMSIPITEVALKLGTITSLGWFIGINRDATNYVELRVSTGSTKFAKLTAGKFAIFQFGSGITAPYAIADTAACQLDYLLISL